MLLALWIALAAVALALLAWVYFDALELGKPAIGWTLAQITLGWALFAPLVLYVIFRDNGQRRLIPPGGARRQATYIFSFVGFSVLAFDAAMLLAVLITRILTGDSDADFFREVVVSSVVTGLASGILWAAFWFPSEKRLPEMDDGQEFVATVYLRRGYLYTLIGVSWIVAFFSALWFFGGVLSAIMGADYADASNWVWAIGPLLVALFSVLLHQQLYLSGDQNRALQQRFDALPPLPIVGGNTAAPALVAASASSTRVTQPAPQASADAEAPRRFCSQCGGRLAPGERFCSSCGAAVPS